MSGHATARRDITGDIGNLYEPNPATIPMYSYSTPAYYLWQAVYDGLREAGISDAKAIEWLQSKHARWAMDGSLGDAIRKLGHDYGLQAGGKP